MALVAMPRQYRANLLLEECQGVGDFRPQLSRNCKAGYQGPSAMLRQPSRHQTHPHSTCSHTSYRRWSCFPNCHGWNSRQPAPRTHRSFDRPQQLPCCMASLREEKMLRKRDSKAIPLAGRGPGVLQGGAAREPRRETARPAADLQVARAQAHALANSRTRVADRGVDPALQFNDKKARVEQYLKEGRFLRTDGTIKRARATSISVASPGNLEHLKKIGFRADRRLPRAAELHAPASGGQAADARTAHQETRSRGRCWERYPECAPPAGRADSEPWGATESGADGSSGRDCFTIRGRGGGRKDLVMALGQPTPAGFRNETR